MPVAAQVQSQMSRRILSGGLVVEGVGECANATYFFEQEAPISIAAQATQRCETVWKPEERGL